MCEVPKAVGGVFLPSDVIQRSAAKDGDLSQKTRAGGWNLQSVLDSSVLANHFWSVHRIYCLG